MTGQETSLEESINNADTALALCLCNQFTKAEAFLEPLDDTCIYHAVSKATISYLQALLTFEQEYIEKAYQKVKVTSQMCDSFRRKQTWGETLHSWVGKPNFDDFTELELHAELCYAECLLERAMLTFIQDENLIAFIKGGLKIRSAYNLYKYAMAALQQKPKTLEHSRSKAHFESGVYMGMGSFNVLLSLLPAKVLRLLEWVGFSGDKKNGLMWLDQGHHLDGLRSPMCAITLLGYHIVVSPLLGIGDTDVPYARDILSVYLKKHPESSMFLYFAGRLSQTQGKIDEALSAYEKSVSLNIDWQQIHHICYWEMMWCHSFKCDWLRAAEYAKKLSVESKWSKCGYSYMYATLLMMHQFELKYGDEAQQKEAESMTEQIETILDNVSQHKQRIAGKSIPFEKFAVCRVEKYKATGKLLLPGIEIIHIWNGFTMLSSHTKTLEHYLRLTELALEELKTEPPQDQTKHHCDNVCICKLLQGICLRHLKRTKEAEKVLLEVAASASSSHSSKMDCYMPAYAAAEVGFMYRSIHQYEKAYHQLQYCLKHYSKYGLESRLHFRIHNGIETLKEILKRKEESNGKLEDDDFFDIDHHVSTQDTVAAETSAPENVVDSKKVMDNAGDVNNVTDNIAEVKIVMESTDSAENRTMNIKDDSKSDKDHLIYNGHSSSNDSRLNEPRAKENPKQEVKKSPRSSPRSPRHWFKKKTTPPSTEEHDSDEFHTPVSSPTLSEASSDISPAHAYLKPSPEMRAHKVTSV